MSLAGGAEPPRLALERLQLVVEDQRAVVQQPADQGRFAVIDRPAGQKAQQVPVARASRASHAKPPSEIALALFALHRRVFVAVDQPALPLGAARVAQFGDDLGGRRSPPNSIAPVSG